MDIERAKRALRAAHEAGDTAAAQRLATAIRGAQQAPMAPQAPTMPAQPQAAGLGATPPPAQEPAMPAQPAAASPVPEAIMRQTLDERAGDVLGFKDYERRGTILPFARTAEGETEFAWPQIVVDLAKSAMLPGHVAQGGQFSEEDVTRFALDVGMPGTQRVGGLAGRRVPTQRQWVKSAPTPEQRAAEASALYRRAEDMSFKVKPESYDKFLDDLGGKLKREGYNKNLNKPVRGALKALREEKGLGQTPQGLDIAKRQIDSAVTDPKPANQRLGRIMNRELDKYISRLGPDDVSGTADPSELGQVLRGARQTHQMRRKTEAVDDIIDRAQRAKSGFENGLVNEANKAINRNKKRPVFNDEEVKVLREIAKGGPRQKSMRLLAKLSPIRSDAGNLAGGVSGAGLGGVVGGLMGGPTGAVIGAGVGPTLGFMGQKAAERTAARQGNLLRAMAAHGAAPPVLPASQRYEMLARGIGPVLGAQLGED